MSGKDDYGIFGPSYSIADNIKLPGEVGVRQEASFGAILDSIAGVNYYVDTIAFGGRTFFDGQNPQPMGIRYFLDTGMRCSNGASMSEYFDGVTRGDLLGSRVAAGLASAGLPGLKGLAPGMLENARDALDPRPIFAAVTATGYPVCQQISCPVGDVNGVIQNPDDSTPYILGDVQYVGGLPQQTRWVQGYDSTGSPINITKDEFGASAKCYNADGSYMDNPPSGCPATQPTSMSAQGTDRYALCTVIQPPSPPASASVESFQSSDPQIGMLAAASVAILGGIALWAVCRK